MDDKKIKEIAVIAAEAAGDKKGVDIEVLDVRELTTIADYFVICTGNSDTQVKAITREVEDRLAVEGIVPQKVAGKQEARWILLDYGIIIVHVFYKEERDYYELDRLWADAEKILSNS